MNNEYLINNLPMWTMTYTTILWIVLLIWVSILYFLYTFSKKNKFENFEGKAHSIALVLTFSVFAYLLSIRNFGISKINFWELENSNYRLEFIKDPVYFKFIGIKEIKNCQKINKAEKNLGEGNYAEKMVERENLTCSKAIVKITCNDEFSVVDCLHKIKTNFNSLISDGALNGSD